MLDRLLSMMAQEVYGVFFLLSTHQLTVHMQSNISHPLTGAIVIK